MRARLASGNPHKLEELRAALHGWELELLETEREYPPEDGTTYYENARAKAAFGRESAAGEWVLGEDSGIEVVALGGRARDRIGPLGRRRRRPAARRARRRRRPSRALRLRARRARPRRCGTARHGDSRGRDRDRAARRRGLRLRPDLRPDRRGPDRGAARQRLEARQLAPRPARQPSPRPCPDPPCPGSDPVVSDPAVAASHFSLQIMRIVEPAACPSPGHARQARPAISSSSRRPYHQLTSAPKTITFAIT